jgi:hypothetical protein
MHLQKNIASAQPNKHHATDAFDDNMKDTSAYRVLDSRIKKPSAHLPFQV